MTIAYVSSTVVGANSISSMPTHAASDLLLMFAANMSGTTAITIPAGWTTLGGGGNLNGFHSQVAYKIAASASEVSGTWTNATGLCLWVGNDSVNYLIPGSSWSRAGSAGTTTISYGVLVMNNATSWIIGFGSCNSNSTDFESAPTGMTNRASATNASPSSEYTAHDSNGVLSSWGATNRTNSGSVGYHAAVLQVFDSGIAKAASGASPRFGLAGGGPSFRSVA